MIWTVSKHVIEKKQTTSNGIFFKNRALLTLAALALVLTGFVLFKSFTKNARDYNHGEEMHPVGDFKKKIREVCSSPVYTLPRYKGVGTFFDFITNPDTEQCYSWLEFGGEKIMIPTMEEKNCLDEIRKTKMICFNEEYQMTKDPCLVYSFTKDADQQFERDMHMFSCYVHVFDSKQVEEAEHVKRTEFWMEHAWDIAEYPYDKPASPEEKVFAKDGVIRRRSLDFIAHTLKHEGNVINYIKSDNEGREWILLKQIIMNKDLVDVQQIGVRIHLPTSVNKMPGTGRHEYFRDLYQIFEGLSCMGYKYVLGRPAKYYRGAIKVPEIEKKYFIAYELNFMKTMNNTQKIKL